MNRTFRTIAMMAAAVFVSSCAIERLEPENGLEGGIPLNIDGSINQVHTKATAAGFVDKDALGLYAVNYSQNNTVAGTLVAKGNQADNVKYVFDEPNHKWVPTKGVYYKDANTNVDLYLYYPHTETVSDVDAGTFEVQKDQSKAETVGALSGYEASDFLWGKATNITPTGSKVSVVLDHKLAAVNVTLTEGTGFAAGEFESLDKNVIVVNTTRKATINYATGEVKPVGGPQSDGIVMCPQTDGSFRAIVVPQTVAAGTKLLAITVDGISYGFGSATAAASYQAGKQTNITVKISKKSAAGDYAFEMVDNQIVPWTEDKNTHGGKARQYYVVDVQTPGTLGRLIKAAKKNPAKIRNLKVTGQITSEDFYFMRDSMTILEAINLKEVKVKNVNVNGDIQTYVDDVIPHYAFNNKTSLCYFSFPEKVTRIGTNAFANTTLSGALVIPDDVTIIGANAFQSTNIGSVTFGHKLTEIQYAAFAGCGALACELHLPESLKSIGDSAFKDCSLRGKLILPRNLEYIGEWAFDNAGDFTCDLVIPEKIKTIKRYTFTSSTFTGNLNLNNVTKLEHDAFSNCYFTGELIIPEEVLVIPSGCFNHNNFKSVIFPSTLKKIEGSAFYSNHRLQGKLTFPEGFSTIGGGAFYYCEQINALHLPSSMQTIGAGAFDRCHQISNITCDASEPPTVQNGAFDGVAKDNFTVEVPSQSVMRYQAEPGWGDFKRIAAHYDFSMSRERMRALNARQQRTFVLRAPANLSWKVESKPEWLTVTPASGTGKTNVTITVDEMPRTTATFEVNEGSFNSPSYVQYKGRAGEVVFSLTEKNYKTSFSVEQYDSDFTDGQTKTYQTATKGAGIDIVFVGDGYDAKDIAKGTFFANSDAGYKHFFDVEPYTTYKDYFNVYAVVSQSDESGIGTVNTIIDTKFGSSFTEGRILPPTPEPVFKWAMKAKPSMDLSKSLTIMLMNTSTYEGVCMMYGDGSAIACCPISTDAYPYDFRGIIQHEAGGHGFGKLGDEYIYHNAFIQTCKCEDGCDHPKDEYDMSSNFGIMKSLGWYKNLSLSSDAMTKVPWSHLIYNPKYSDYVDMYEGGYMHMRGVYRSEATSCMNNNIPYYSAISRQAIVERIMEYAGEPFTLEKFYLNDKNTFGPKTKGGNVGIPFGVRPDFVRATGRGPIFMGERPNIK